MLPWRWCEAAGVGFIYICDRWMVFVNTFNLNHLPQPSWCSVTRIPSKAISHPNHLEIIVRKSLQDPLCVEVVEKGKLLTRFVQKNSGNCFHF